MKKIIILLSLYVFVININAQTLLPATISVNTLLNDKVNYYYSNGSVSVPAGIILTISEGVEIRMANAASIGVAGSIICNGTESEPIIINAIDTNSRWNKITVNNGYAYLKHLKIYNAVQFISSNYGGINLYNCFVDSTFGGIGADCIALHNVDSIIMMNCELHGDPTKARIDAIDCDATTRGVFKFNKILDFEDDGFDIGTGASNVIIDSNYIFNCNFGISVGESSIVNAYGNIIVSCDGALQSHHGSLLNVNHCTLYNNVKGIECHHGSDANAAGDMNVFNTVFSQTINTIFTLQEGADLSIKYSISDTEIINDDTTNIFDDPLFVYPDTGNFNLQASSPCIDTGDPYEQYDSCCKRIDIGAIEAPCGIADPECQGPPPPPPPPLSINNEENIQISYYPNPITDKICIDFNQNISEEYLFKLIDINGKLLFKQIISEKNECLFISELESGNYIFQVINLNNNKIIGSQKIINF